MGDTWQRFAKEVAAKNEEGARHTILSDLGSKHRLARRLIQVKAVTPLKPEEVTDAVVRYRIGAAQ